MFGSFTEKPYFCIEVRTSVVQKKTNKLLINNKNKLIMKKIFTLVSMAFIAMSVNAQTEESYVAVDADGNMSTEYASVIDENSVATNVENGNSVVKFSTTNVSVEAVGSAVPADKKDPEDPTVSLGQDITVGALIDETLHLYELLSINSTDPIKWEKKNQGDINFSYIAGTGVPAVSMVAEEIYTDGEATGKYRVVYTTFDPEKGGEPKSGLYYKFTTKVDGALKVGIWANKGNRLTLLVDSETKACSQYLVEGYINGQTWKEEDVEAGLCTADQVGQKKWLSNDAIRALGSEDKPWVIGAGNQPFWGNVVIDAKAGKTYWLFQSNSQIGFQKYTFYPGKSKEEVIDTVTGLKYKTKTIKSKRTITTKLNIKKKTKN